MLKQWRVGVGACGFTNVLSVVFVQTVQKLAQNMIICDIN